MTAPNRQRGEVAIALGGRGFVLRPTYQALCAIESALDCGLVALYRRIVSHDFGLREITVIVTEGLIAAGEPATREKVGTMIAEAGLLSPEVVEPVTEFLALALTGGRASGEDDVASKKKEPGPTPSPGAGSSASPAA